MTRFVKKDLRHTSNLPILMTHKFRLVQATDLKFGQQKVQTQLNDWKTFQLHLSFDSQVVVFYVSLENWMCEEDPFSQIRSHIGFSTHIHCAN